MEFREQFVYYVKGINSEAGVTSGTKNKAGGDIAANLGVNVGFGHQTQEEIKVASGTYLYHYGVSIDKQGNLVVGYQRDGASNKEVTKMLNQSNVDDELFRSEFKPILSSPIQNKTHKLKNLKK
ncbi:hypothetical protein [Tenacibaculum sp. 190524A02b]|uniref:hypothetical protein n=1 Tax=Tenacibaculum vairaonense TaxID=3137860 RepID=UPI0031FB13E4